MKTATKNTLFGISACAALLAACDVSNTDDDLPGSWERMREDGTIRDRYLFLGDGSFTFDELKPDDRASEDHITGTYTATDDTLVATGTNAKDGARSQISVTYYVNARMFATQAWRPAGPHQGIVGEWTAAVKLEFPDEPARPAEGGTATFNFRGDGTFTATGTRTDGTVIEAEEGTYREETPGMFRTISTSGTFSHSLQMIDDAALVFASRIFRRWLPY